MTYFMILTHSLSTVKHDVIVYPSTWGTPTPLNVFLSQNGLNALHLASKEGHVEVVAELLKLEAAVDAATKVRPTPSPIIWRTIFRSRAKYGCIVGLNSMQLLYSMTTVSVQPLLGFNIGSIFNDSCGDFCWKKSERIKKEKWNIYQSSV